MSVEILDQIASKQFEAIENRSQVADGPLGARTSTDSCPQLRRSNSKQLRTVRKWNVAPPNRRSKINFDSRGSRKPAPVRQTPVVPAGPTAPTARTRQTTDCS